MTTLALRDTVAGLLFAGGRDETRECASLSELGLEHPERSAYIPSTWYTLRLLLPTAAVQPSDVFVDFGCGKGRVVWDAARRYRFRSVIGVELSEELATAAQRFVARRPRRRAGSVQIVCADATRFAIPDDMTYAYMFSPFIGETFERVRDNILASLDRSPRPLTLIYVNPAEHALLAATGRFELVRRMAATRLASGFSAAIYKVT